MQNCGTCKFGRPMKGAPVGVLECRFNPPQVSAILIPRGPGQAEIQTPSAFPTVTAELDCGQWKPTIHIDVELHKPG